MLQQCHGCFTFAEGGIKGPVGVYNPDNPYYRTYIGAYTLQVMLIIAIVVTG